MQGRTPSEDQELCGIWTREPAMIRLFDHTRRFACVDAPVLIQGETGTGKELVARGLHLLSERRARPFVVIDCTLLPEALAESELFGHQRGSFTGADRTYAGLIEAADGGTVFIDEVNSLPLGVQAKLLRFLEEGQIHRIGQQNPVRVDVRLIAASNVPLAECVRAGQVRADFFHRLNVLLIDLPPLRERLADIPVLVRQFLSEDPLAKRLGVTEVTENVMAQLATLPWPGNVRELRNILRRSIMTGPGGCVLRHLDIPFDAPPPPPSAPKDRGEHEFIAFRAWMREREREYLAGLMERFDGAAQQAAISGLPPRTLYRKLKSLGLNGSSRNGAQFACSSVVMGATLHACRA